MIKDLFKKSFNIREGELQVALLMQLYIFLVITVLLLVKPTVTALFLSGLGPEKLPYGYLMVAVVAVLSSVFYNKMIRIFSIKAVALATIMIFSGLFFLLSFVVYSKIAEAWILYFYYIIISLFGVLVTSQFWVIANIVFDLREAKRLFGFIGAGAIAGGIFGGYLTTFLANFFGNSIVSLIAGILLLLCIPLIFWIWRVRVDHLNKYTKEERKKEEEVSGSSWSVVFGSKHLANLSAIVGVSVVVAKLVDYQFNDLSHMVFSDPDELASFFGFWFSTFNIIALLLQLFLTNRFMSRFGVTTNMMFLPMGLAIGSFLFFIFPELWVMVLIKGVDGSFKQSLNKAAYELSFLPVSYDVKKQAKPFIDVVIDSIATGLTGFLLLYLINGLNLEAKYFTFIILFFLLIWIFLIFRLRESYFDTFRKNISQLVVSKKKGKRKKKKNSIEAIRGILTSGNEKEILALLSHISDDMVQMFIPDLKKLLDHPSDKVKTASIKEIYSYGDIQTVNKLKDLIEKSNNDELVYEAMEYLLAHSVVNNKEEALYYLNHKKDYVKDAALLCLARSSRYNYELSKKYDLDKRIVNQIKEFTEHEDMQRKEEIAALLLSIGYYGKKEYFHVIDKYLEGKDPLLIKSAIKAAGLTKSDIFIDKLLDMMVHKEYHDEVVKALKLYGDSMVNVLYNKDRDEEFDEKARGYIPEIIQAFETKESIVMLMRLLESKDVLVRLNAARSLNKLEDQNHKLRFSDKRLNDLIFNEIMYFKNTIVAVQSVEDAYKKTEKSEKKDAFDKEKAQTVRRALLKHLQKQMDFSLEVIFNLLAIKYTDSDMKVAFQGIKNDTEESRINSIEFLSNLLDVELKRELLPLLEYRFLGDNETNIDIKKVSEIKSLISLINEHGIVSKSLALRLMHFIPHKSANKILKKLLKHKNPRIRSLARNNLD